MANPLWPPGAHAPVDLSRPYYVIIGMGFSALLDHLTLRSSPHEERLNGLDVLHIGLTDPWKLYESAPMGQWASLLTLPAFRFQPANLRPEAFLSSAEFVRVLEDEWLDLANRFPFFALEAEVQAIRQAGPHYEIDLAGEPPVTIVASKIDICGGPGPARRLDNRRVLSNNLRQEYRDNAPGVRRWPRLVTGDAFLTRAMPLPPAGSAVLVFGGGPTGAWCVERAQAQGFRVVWMSRDPLRGAFLSTKRNDLLAQPPLSRSYDNGAYTIDHDVFPAHASTVFAEGYEIATLDEQGFDVEAVFQALPNSKLRWVDRARADCTPDPLSERFAQVIVAIGQCKGTREPGSWAQLLHAVIRPDLKGRSNLIRDMQNRAVGIESRDGNVRVLGASALSHPEMEAEWKDSASSSYAYFATLCAQARVRLGIALSAVTVAEANRWFQAPGRPRNLNMATLREVRALLGAQAPFADMAESWIDPRRARIHPWTHDELLHLIQSTRDRY